MKIHIVKTALCGMNGTERELVTEEKEYKMFMSKKIVEPDLKPGPRTHKAKR